MIQHRTNFQPNAHRRQLNSSRWLAMNDPGQLPLSIPPGKNRTRISTSTSPAVKHTTRFALPTSRTAKVRECGGKAAELGQQVARPAFKNTMLRIIESRIPNLTPAQPRSYWHPCHRGRQKLGVHALALASLSLLATQRRSALPIERTTTTILSITMACDERCRTKHELDSAGKEPNSHIDINRPGG